MRAAALGLVGLLGSFGAAFADTMQSAPARAESFDLDAPAAAPQETPDPFAAWPEAARALAKEAFDDAALLAPSRVLEDGATLRVRPLRRLDGSDGEPCGVFVLSLSTDISLRRRDVSLCLKDGDVVPYGAP